MSADRAHAAAVDMVARINDAIRTGRVENIIGLQADIRSLLAGSKLSPKEPLVERLRAAWAQTALIMIDRRGAGEALAAYLGADGAFRKEATDAPRSARFRPRYERGLVLTALANLRYRQHEFQEGAAIAELADHHLRRAAEVHELDATLARSQNAIWRARLLWHCDQPNEAKAQVRLALADLARALRGEKEKGGAELLAALAYGLWAQWDWRTGRLGKAREKGYQALFLLQGVTMPDGKPAAPIRTAHILLTAGLIERSHNRPELNWAGHVFRRSVRLFMEAGHPFEARARVQLARCHAANDEAELEREELGHIQRLHEHLQVADPSEAALLNGELTLTRLWQLEHEARTNAPQLWAECARLSDELLADNTAAKERFRLERDVHWGLATAMLGPEAFREEGRKTIEEAHRQASDNREPKLAIAALLALAEATLSSSEHRARSYWEEAALLLETTPSSSLTRWKDWIGAKLHTPVSFQIDDDMKYSDAVDDFTRAYLKHQVARHREFSKLKRAIGLSGSHLYRLLAKHGIDTGGTPRRVRKP